MLDKLIGAWKVIGCQLNTRWLPDSIFREFRYKFTKDKKFSLEWAEVTYPEYIGGFPKSKSGKVKLNMDQTPYQIDFIPDEGPFAQQTLQGIFELDHDILKVNFAFPGHDRPRQFTAKNGQVYEIWQRIS